MKLKSKCYLCGRKDYLTRLIFPGCFVRLICSDCLDKFKRKEKKTCNKSKREDIFIEVDENE